MNASSALSLGGGLSGTSLAIEWGARPYRDREVMVPWTKGKTVPGWAPHIPLERGLGELEWDLSNFSPQR